MVHGGKIRGWWGPDFMEIDVLRETWPSAPAAWAFSCRQNQSRATQVCWGVTAVICRDAFKGIRFPVKSTTVRLRAHNKPEFLRYLCWRGLWKGHRAVCPQYERRPVSPPLNCRWTASGVPISGRPRDRHDRHYFKRSVITRQTAAATKGINQVGLAAVIHAE